MIRITDNLGNIVDVELEEIIPLTPKEIVFNRVGNCVFMLFSKGLNFRLSLNSVILTRRIPIAKAIKINGGYKSTKKHKLQYFQVEQKVSFVFKNDELDEVETNIAIMSGANLLIKRSMIASRKLKALRLESEINDLQKKLLK